MAVSAAPRLRVSAAGPVDVLAYLVVLGFFVQFFPAIISESFVMTLLTAILLKVTLEAVTAVKKRALAARDAADTRWRRVISVATLVLLLPGSKFVILWLTELAFGGAVKLGGFWVVTLLIVVLMFARGLVRRLLVPHA